MIAHNVVSQMKSRTRPSEGGSAARRDERSSVTGWGGGGAGRGRSRHSERVRRARKSRGDDLERFAGIADSIRPDISHSSTCFESTD